jgi:Protein of unknown function (DUF2530)
MPRPPRATPEPLETNDVLIAAVGTGGWMIALVALLLVGLPPDNRWWLWVCVAGVGGGLFGMWYIPRLQRKRAERERRRDDDGDRPDAPSANGRPARSDRSAADGLPAHDTGAAHDTGPGHDARHAHGTPRTRDARPARNSRREPDRPD